MRIILSILLLSVCYGITINVPADSLTIQAGINGAEEGDTVLVSAGTYVENIVWAATNGIKLIGSGEQDCIIDGDSLASVIRFEQDLDGIIDSTTLITGFIIQNGNAQGNVPNACGGGMYLYQSSPTLTDVTFSNNTSEWSGGGMYIFSYSNPTLIDVTFSNNTSEWSGGGMYLSNYNSPTLTDVTFSNNSAGSEGGGMWVAGSNPALTGVTFSGNTADYHGGGMYITNASDPALTNVIFSGNTADKHGGGIYLYSSSPTLTDVTFSGNTAGETGGGIYLQESNPTLTDVIFSNNTSEWSGGGMYLKNSSPTMTSVTFSGNTAYSAGGMFLYQSSLTLTDVTFSGNTADWGGGMYLSFTSPTLINVTFSGNTAVSGGGMYLHTSSPTLTNSILWGNSPQEIYFTEDYDPNSIIITYSDIQGGEAGIATNDNGTVYWLEGNINADPLFCDPENGNLTLAANSPCLNAGQNGANMGALGVGDCGELSVQNDPIPSKYSISSIYPNPFNPATTISFSIPEFGLTTITAYDITGRQLETLTNEVLSVGSYSINWNASDYPSGVYLIRMISGDFTQTQKVVLVK